MGFALNLNVNVYVSTPEKYMMVWSQEYSTDINKIAIPTFLVLPSQGLSYLSSHISHTLHQNQLYSKKRAFHEER